MKQLGELDYAACGRLRGGKLKAMGIRHEQNKNSPGAGLRCSFDISVVIVSFNTRDMLKGCLKSIYENIPPRLDCEIIVVDNASKDGSPEMLIREFDKVVLMSNQQNVGFSRANNQAFTVARGRYLLLINSDCFVQRGTLGTLVTFMDEHPGAAAAGPKILNPDMTLQSKGFAFPSVRRALLVATGLNLFLSESFKSRLFPGCYWAEDRVGQVDFVEGSCMVMRKEALERVGLLSEEFFLYFEDEEWCHRARKAGCEVWYVPSAEVVHVGSGSPSESKEELFNRSRLRYYVTTVGRARGLVITLMMAAAAALNVLRQRIVYTGAVERRATRRELSRELALLRSLVFGRGA